MARLRDDELWAQACIQHALPGCSVEQHDDGSRPGMYDLKIVYPDGSTGAVEVTAAADAPRVDLWREVRKRAMLRQESSLAGGWLVRILPSARARELDRQLPGLLQELEREGRRVIWGARASGDQLEARAGRLGIAEAHQSATDRPGSIYVMPPEGPREQMGGYAPLSGDPLAVWLGEWLADPRRSDNVRKLLASGADERHVFVLVPGFTQAPFAVIDLLISPDAPMPVIPPALPGGIAHVWTMSNWDSGDGFRWSPKAGWTRFGKVAPPSSETESPE